MDLPIKAGDVLNVDDANSSGDWWYGCNQEGRYGYFPSNFVKEVSGSPSSIEEKEKEEIGIFLVRALYPYFARTEDDLSFEAGDKIEVRQREGNWWLGVNRSSNDPSKEGLFPSNYVQLHL